MSQTSFLRLTEIALISIYLVILAGGIVRMSGSGMGCPDWSKCFDRYIPPTSVEELPENYKEIYSSKREKKIKKFSNLLSKLGMKDKANQLLNDKALLIEQEFNPINTWTEYINRLSGALAGFFILGVFIFSWKFKKLMKGIVILSFSQLIVTYLQAWLGSMVVATHIVPWVLTVHMVLALLMIFIQIQIIKRAELVGSKIKKREVLTYLLATGVLILIIQVILGTQVRQIVDGIGLHIERADWVDYLGLDYIIHRTVALAYILLAIGLWYFNSKGATKNTIVNWIIFLIILEALVGKALTYFGMPAFLQPAHLLLSMLLFGALLIGLYTINYDTRNRD